MTFSLSGAGLLVDYLEDEDGYMDPPSVCRVFHEMMHDNKRDLQKVHDQIYRERNYVKNNYIRLRFRLQSMKKKGLLTSSNATTQQIEDEEDEETRNKLIEEMHTCHREYMKDLEKHLVRYVTLRDIYERLYNKIWKLRISEQK